VPNMMNSTQFVKVSNACSCGINAPKPKIQNFDEDALALF
jgi:hypothetical protein